MRHAGLELDLGRGLQKGWYAIAHNYHPVCDFGSFFT